MKKLKKGYPKTLVIQRKIWGRGETGGALRKKVRDTFKHCCLGILALKQGCSVREIQGNGSPADLTDKRSEKEVRAAFPKMISRSGEDSAVAEEMMSVNDNTGISETDRETRLAKLFGKIGIKIKFK